MGGDLDDLAFGERLQTIRERRGITRVVLAGLVGRSPSWVKKAEKQPGFLPDLGMLVKLARALKLRSVGELVGPMEVPVDVDVRSGHDQYQFIRDAVMSWDLPHQGDPIPAPDLRRRARELMHVWHMDAAPRAATTRLLPELITDTRHAMRLLEGQDRRMAAAALVETYTVAEHWLSWIADRDLMMIIADRAMQAAEIADDPHVAAEAAWGWGNTMRYVDAETTISLIDKLAKPLRTAMDNDTADDEQAAIWGSLQLHQAITHAQSGSEANALRHLDAAEHVAERLPGRWQHPLTVFAAWNVDIHGVSVQAELCKGSEGSRLALAIDPDTVPGPYRRSRLWLDAARAWWADGDPLGAVTALNNACEVSHENMKYTPPAKTLAGALVDDGGLMIAPQARRLARELDVIV
jgi:transcriptional regulator with XRE-family HTH domain